MGMSDDGSSNTRHGLLTPPRTPIKVTPKHKGAQSKTNEQREPVTRPLSQTSQYNESWNIEDEHGKRPRIGVIAGRDSDSLKTGKKFAVGFENARPKLSTGESDHTADAEEKSVTSSYPTNHNVQFPRTSQSSLKTDARDNPSDAVGKNWNKSGQSTFAAQDFLLSSFDGEGDSHSTVGLLEVGSSDPTGQEERAESKVFLVDRSLNPRLRPSQRKPPIEGFKGLPWCAPDRFVSGGKHSYGRRDNLIIGTPAYKLVGEEKVFRQRGPRSDPFGSLNRNRRRRSQATVIQPLRHSRAGGFRSRGILEFRHDMPSNVRRQVSNGAVWNIGGAGAAVIQSIHPITRRVDARIGVNNTPVYMSRFLQRSRSSENLEILEKRLALALDIDQTNKILVENPTWFSNGSQLKSLGCPYEANSPNYSRQCCAKHSPVVWKDNRWLRDDEFVLLEAPNLRDDFYCSVLAYSKTVNSLAVALGEKVYLWSEAGGVQMAPLPLESRRVALSYVTSLSYSSLQGGRAILAAARIDGQVTLYSPKDKERERRFLRIFVPAAASHLSFRPTILRRPSQRHSALIAENEVLLVGDDAGTIWIYLVEWPADTERFLFGWHGGTSLHAKVAMHSQQICGIAWSPDGEAFATGGNDNLCCLIQSNRIFSVERSHSPTNANIRNGNDGSTIIDLIPGAVAEVVLQENNARHQWRLNAAVKAIAFCPWQRGLVAVGGGSNDRCIHFYHTISGASLATIDCAAQITSLIWSTTRREIAATFGFAQPEHPYRIAVYSWPDCQQVVAIPWHDEMRALYAIPYPGGSDVGRQSREGGPWASRTAEEGCIVVAGSDCSIKFHEIWSETRRATGPHRGLLGGSDILESLHGIDRDDSGGIR